MATAKYSTITKLKGDHYRGGYKSVVLFCPIEDFLSIKMPGVAAALGDSVKITEAHTFTPPNGFKTWDCKTATVTITAETNGDPGEGLLTWQSVFVVLGDSASTQEQMQNLISDKLIFLLKDSECGTSGYVQLGDECNEATASVAFTGNTTAEGKKEYAVTVTARKKYFYSGAVVMDGDTQE